MNNNDITFKKATEELESILRAIENDTVDVDELTQKVQRSSELIRICKQKLRNAETAINDVFQDIDCDPAAPEVSGTEKKQAPTQMSVAEDEDDGDGELPF